MKMLRQGPLAIVQQLVDYAIAVSTAVRNRVTGQCDSLLAGQLRGCWAASHLNTSASQNALVSIPLERPENWLPFFFSREI